MRELINTIAHIGYQVSDLTRSLAFYEPLGFQRQQRFSKPSPQGTIEVAFLEMAGAVLELYQLPAGTPFVAPADGVVVLAAATPFTLEGNLLIVDHGSSYLSIYGNNEA